MENNKIDLTPIKRRVSAVVKGAETLAIETKENLITATDILGKIKLIGKEIKENKERVTKPLNEALRNTRELFRPIEDEWIEAERIVKGKMINFNEIELEKARKKEEEIIKKAEAGKIDAKEATEKIEAIVPQKEIKAKKSSIQFRTIKEVIIEDASKLPRKYLTPWMTVIRADALKGIKIAGVKVIKKQIVAGRSY